MADPVEQCQANRTRVTKIWKAAQLEAQKAKATIDKNPVAAKELDAAKTYADLAASFSKDWAVWAAQFECLAGGATDEVWASLSLSGEDYAKRFIKLNDAVWNYSKGKKKKRAAEKKAAPAAQKPAVEAAQKAEDVAAKTENDAKVPPTSTPDGADLSKGVGKGEGSSDFNWMLWGGLGLIAVGAVIYARSRSSTAITRR